MGEKVQTEYVATLHPNRSKQDQDCIQSRSQSYTLRRTLHVDCLGFCKLKLHSGVAGIEDNFWLSKVCIKNKQQSIVFEK